MNGIELLSWCKFGILGLPVCVCDIRTRSMFRSLPKTVLLLNVLWYYYVKYFANFFSPQIQWARFALLFRVFFFPTLSIYLRGMLIAQLFSLAAVCCPAHFSYWIANDHDTVKLQVGKRPERKTYWQKNKGVLQIVSRKSHCQKLRPLPFLQTIFVWRIYQVVLHQRCEMKFRRWSQPATTVTLREHDGHRMP